MASEYAVVLVQDTPEDIEIRDKHELDLLLRKHEWIAIEKLIMLYKAQFAANINAEKVDEVKRLGQIAAGMLIEKFSPIFKKYLNLLKQGTIDFGNPESRKFVISFIGDQDLKKALRERRLRADIQHQVYSRFNFIRETYGSQSNEEILLDLHLLFLEMAKRYRQMGKNFCAYLNTCFRYEVSRHIKNYISIPSNIAYKTCEYEDYMLSAHNETIEEDYFEDRFYENSVGMPDMSWISGESCSDLFQTLSPLERKLLIKYYLEDCNDRMIADEFVIHINTTNQKRRQAVGKLAKKLGIDESQIKRNRKSGKNTISPFHVH